MIYTTIFHIPRLQKSPPPPPIDREIEINMELGHMKMSSCQGYAPSVPEPDEYCCTFLGPQNTVYLRLDIHSWLTEVVA